MADFTQGAEGAAGGAAAGAAFGPVGMGIGALAGGAMGLFGNSGASQYQSQYQNLANQYGARTAQTGTAQQSGGAQQGLVAQLQAMAAGNGPSAAALQMKQAMDQAVGAQASAAAGAGGRGVNAGAALRNASNNNAQQASNIANQTGQMRVNEQLGAINQLVGVRGQDLSNQQFNASQGNQMTQANMQAYLNMQQLNQQGQLGALAGASGVAGPGTGASLMAGGASMLPGLLQYGRGTPGGTGSGTSAFSWGQSGSQYT